jgi:hypothetical protein
MLRRALITAASAVFAGSAWMGTALATTSTSFPGCSTAAQVSTRPFPSGTVLSAPWVVGSPPANHTYKLTGVSSTAYPSDTSAFSFGTSTRGTDTCVLGGTLNGSVDPNQTWEYYHSNFDAACVKVVGFDWLQVLRTRCDSVEDGIRVEEGRPNSNVARFNVSRTYLTNVRDDCMDDDDTLGGVIHDSLWDGCNTGLAERPSTSAGTWTSPSDETVTVDHALIGLQQTQHATKGYGEGPLFKWSSSANHLVIKCSLFKVDALSIDGKKAMAIPAGTVVDDSACPRKPTTIVWLGGGAYPGTLVPGITVTSDPTVWSNAVASWKAAHGY